MKVKELKILLDEYDDDSSIFAWIANDHGHCVVNLGYNDAVIGKTEDGFILLPVHLPPQESFFKWDD